MAMAESQRSPLGTQESSGNTGPDCDSRHRVETQSLTVIGDDLSLTITDQGSVRLAECEQQHEVNIDPIMFLPGTSTLDRTPGSSALHDETLNHSSPAGPQEDSASKPDSHVATSGSPLPDDISSLRGTFPVATFEYGANQYYGFALDSLNQGLDPTAGEAWPYLVEQPFAEESDVATITTAAEDAPKCLDLSMLDPVGISWQQNIWIDVETQNILTMHYFEHICQIMSCFDSRLNPFRKDIPPIMLNCGYMNDCVNGLSAAHLANSVRGMDSIALKHQTNALRGLVSDIRMIEYPDCQRKINNSLSRVSAVYARHDALLAALLLGISTVRSNPEYQTLDVKLRSILTSCKAWYDASATGMIHHHGARALFQRWLVDEGIHEMPKETLLLDREQSFIVGAMAYLECLASIITNQPLESLRYLHRFAMMTQGQKVYPNPWTGISTPLFIYLAASATLIRHKRCRRLDSGQHQETDLGLASHARELYGQVLAHRTPADSTVEDTQDDVTPVTHLVLVDAIFRLVILLELTQVFPELIKLDRSPCELRKSSLNLATAVLGLIAELPTSSGVNIMLSIPLLSAGSALQAIEGVPKNKNYSCDLASESFDALCGRVTALMHRPAVLQIWRSQVVQRYEQLYHRVKLAPVKRSLSIMEAVWCRADKASTSDTFIPGTLIYWMDVMTEEGLETLFG